MNKLYVGGLPFSTTNEELQAFFEKYGAVKEAVVIMDRDTGRSRGFGFVTMEDKEGFNKALGAHGTDMGGRELKVNEAQDKK